ncbi:MAG: wax ester/triacylglycerol synthase family O-acyltransferase [Proteobacteria bacterium]|nr:wax ester/triacylglycerol synthase family O-acyltransferase [Pseudomonadota bacterium]
MNQLSGLDATFLYLETPQMPMHVGALHLYELPPGFRGKFITAVRKHVAERLPATPALRRRLWWMPLNIANPAWVDAVPDLRQHIVPGVSPKNAGIADLEAAVGRLHPQLLDRQRPLWKFHVFEDLAPGPGGQRRAAIYTQLHHAAVDGQAAVALANALLDLTPQPRKLEPRAAKRQRVFKLDMTEMLRGVLASQAGKVAGIIRSLPSTVGTLKDAATQAVSHSALLSGKKGSGNITLAPATVFNNSVTEGRAFASISLPLAELRELGQAHGATLNETVLMLCSSALRRLFAKKRMLPRKSLVAAVPISLRAKGDTSADNQASMSLISLGTHIADPLKRLAHIKAASAAMKSTMGSLKSILPTDFPSLGVPWLLEAATALYGKARVADRIPQVANVVISNVPGPPVPLYMAGAKMLTNYPTSIVVHGMGLNITVQSYDQSLDFGLMADAQALPDVAELAQALRVAFDDLQALPRPGDHDHADTPRRASLVDRAQRGISGAVGSTVGKVTKAVVSSALEGALQGTLQGTVGQVAGRLRPLTATSATSAARKAAKARR